MRDFFRGLKDLRRTRLRLVFGPFPPLPARATKKSPWVGQNTKRDRRYESKKESRKQATRNKRRNENTSSDRNVRTSSHPLAIKLPNLPTTTAATTTITHLHVPLPSLAPPPPPSAPFGVAAAAAAAGAFKPSRAVGGWDVEGVRSVELAAELVARGKRVDVEEEAEDWREDGEGEGGGGGRLLTVGGALEVVEGAGGTPMSGGSFMVGWAYWKSKRGRR